MVPKNEFGAVLGKFLLKFGKLPKIVNPPQTPYSQGFQPFSGCYQESPKMRILDITMSRGERIFSVWGTFLYPLHPCPSPW
jgi:hypothetical protein